MHSRIIRKGSTGMYLRSIWYGNMLSRGVKQARPQGHKKRKHTHNTRESNFITKFHRLFPFLADQTFHKRSLLELDPKNISSDSLKLICEGIYDNFLQKYLPYHIPPVRKSSFGSGSLLGSYTMAIWTRNPISRVFFSLSNTSSKKIA